MRTVRSVSPTRVAEARADVSALEQEDVGALGEDRLGGHVEAVHDGAGLVVEAAAVGRVGADRAAVEAGRERQPSIGAALRAVAVEDVRRQAAIGAVEGIERRGVERVRVAPHRHAGDAEREPRPELVEGLGGALAAGRGIAEDADVEAARDLRPGDVDDMAEQAADRGPEDVQDAKRRAEARCVRMACEGGEVPARLGVQNHRSLITMVSPGRTGKVIGTEAVTSLPSLPRRVSSA